MPTYQYKCTECGEPLEAQQRFSDASLTECPACGGHLRKVFNAVGVVFKGSGFYRNDSRNADAAAASSSSDSGTKSDSKSDSGSKSDSSSKSDSGTGSSSSSDSSSGSKSDTSKSTTPA